jgi:hypothetical protein
MLTAGVAPLLATAARTPSSATQSANEIDTDTDRPDESMAEELMVPTSWDFLFLAMITLAYCAIHVIQSCVYFDFFLLLVGAESAATV